MSIMPHLQLDLPSHYPLEVKRDLAQRLGELYGAIMQTTASIKFYRRTATFTRRASWA
jgi:hypothetical protein